MPSVSNSATPSSILATPNAFIGHVSTISPINANAILNDVHTRQMCFGQAAAAGANFTFCSQIALEASFQAVQLVYVNYGTTPYTVGACAVSASSNLNDNGTTDTWVQGTFSTGNVKDLPPAYGTNVATLTVPASVGTGDSQVPGWAASDWISVSSIPRTDGGTLPLLNVRSWISSASNINNESLTTSLGNLNSSGSQGGRVWYSTFVADATGAFVTAPTSNALLPVFNGTWVCPMAVRVAYSGVSGLNVVTVGDSITRGQQSSTRTTIVTPFGQYACNALSTPSRPITHCMQGWSGQLREATYRNVIWALNNLQPDVLHWFVTSPNDGPSDFNFNRAWNRTIELLDQCLAKGVTPVIATCPPFQTPSAAQDIFRNVLNANVRTLALAGQQGIYVTDFDAYLTNGASPSRLQSPYDSGDGVHPTAAAFQVMGSLFQTTLQTILFGR